MLRQSILHCSVAIMSPLGALSLLAGYFEGLIMAALLYTSQPDSTHAQVESHMTLFKITLCCSVRKPSVASVQQLLNLPPKSQKVSRKLSRAGNSNQELWVDPCSRPHGGVRKHSAGGGRKARE